MIRYFLVLTLLPLTFAGFWYRMYWEYDCPGYKRPIDYSLDECKPYKQCSGIARQGDIAIINVNYTINVENGPFTKLPISAKLMRYPSGKIETILPPHDACHKKYNYNLNCPLQNGKHSLKLKLRMQKVKPGEFIKVGLHINNPSDKPLACVYAGVYSNAKWVHFK
uniref:Putative ml domain salivary peptide n=1 Tax=Nyssomyia neivai TaxID=330878 RepID=A0A1L8DQA8_9DIPT